MGLAGGDLVCCSWGCREALILRLSIGDKSPTTLSPNLQHPPPPPPPPWLCRTAIAGDLPQKGAAAEALDLVWYIASIARWSVEGGGVCKRSSNCKT